ncbi:MAG: ATP-binding protein [Candidatus Acidiferrales bacterium]
MHVLESGRIEYTERAFDQDAAAAMRGKIERALVELITNSDDSYALLEEEGIRPRGLIRIEIDRHRSKPWKVVVRDRAAGMTVEDMKNRLCRVGGQTSGFERGAAVRGMLGRGAKDVAAFGSVIFESIKNDTYCRCCLTNRGQYEIFEPVPTTAEIRRGLQIPSGSGTVVTIDVGPQFAAPQHSTLVERLAGHYALRDICSDLKRNVVLVNLKEPGHKGDPLVYKFPTEKLVLEDAFGVGDYTNGKARIKLFRAPERFVEDQNSPHRQGGVLVKSARAIHEITLFGFEGDPYAEWFFGRLECSFLDDLIREYDKCFEKGAIFPQSNPTRILQRQRDGLVREHPFTILLFAEAKKRLTVLVEREKEKDQEKKTRVENEETTKTLRRLAAAASKFMADKMQEFEIEATGRLGALRMQGDLAIVPSACVIKPGEVKTLSVLVKNELVQRAGARVQLTQEGEGIEVMSSEVPLAPRPDRPDISSGTFKVRGIAAGSMVLVKAFIGDVSSDALVQVEERKEEEIRIPPGLSFEHDSYHVRFGKTKKLVLRAKVVGEDLEGVTVNIASDTAGVLPLKLLVPLRLNAGLACFTAEVPVSGKQLGAKGKILAQLRGFIAQAKVTVVQRDLEGPFSFEIKIVNEDFGPQRATWDHANGILKITARHKSIGRYLGRGEEQFPGQDRPYFKTILAEIVADQVVRRLIEIREEKQGKDEDLDAHAVYATHQKYVGEFLPVAHEIQLPSSELQKIR